MRSLPASQLADDGEADGTPVPPAYDPASEEPLPHRDGARKSVGPPPIGRNPNVEVTDQSDTFFFGSFFIIGTNVCPRRPNSPNSLGPKGVPKP